MMQLSLPGFDLPCGDDALPLPFDDDGETQDSDTLQVPLLLGQLTLFSVECQLLTLMYDSARRGHFEEAGAVRDRLVRLEGVSKETSVLALLDQIGASGFWTRSSADIGRDCLELLRRTLLPPAIREGLLVRLLETNDPSDLIRQEPGLLGFVVNHLRNEPSGAGLEASQLVRDALLSGLSPISGDFEDETLRDLLAEDYSPVWLACLGALRGLWSVAAAESLERAPSLLPVPADDEERGRQFWLCLRWAVARDHTDVLALDAKKRMRQLNVDFHGLFMRRGVVWE